MAAFGRFIVCAMVLAAASRALVQAAEPQPADGLIEFTSKERRFSVRLPAKPEADKTTVGDAKETQYQFQVASERGAYLISYQDNPNLAGKGTKDVQAALVVGRDAIQASFDGKLLESEEVKLDDAHPGLSFRVTIPAAKGEARCRMYMVGTRLYQILVIGLPEFTAADEATRVIESFKVDAPGARKPQPR